jgi:hypothetical protein
MLRFGLLFSSLTHKKFRSCHVLIPELGVDHSRNLTKIMLNSISMRKLFFYHVMCGTPHLFERSEVILRYLVN